ncbi:MAG: DUF1015 domain-containing protein [Clostridia bacterium]|nr:DUF1015 domain-containing protein [Clostridia bacterium]
MAVFKAADILIPQNVDFTKWSVVACDQYTSEPEYWEDVKNIVGGNPSTLNIIYPEVYLEEENSENRIKNINETMQRYLDDGLFLETLDSIIYTERTQSDGRTRKGIIGMLDLDEYDFSKGSQSMIRATEGTIIERIPPRQRVRRGAPLELPHIIMLIDDRTKSIIEPLAEKTERFERLYDFDLMKNGGHLKGYLVDEVVKQEILGEIEKLGDKAAFEEKYNVKDKGVLMFAAGDGNHSLATAKSCWEEIKKTLSDKEKENHPARFALVEVMNIHDDALEFEPIQRVIFDVDGEKLLEAFKAYYETSDTDNGGQRVDYVVNGREGSVYIKNPSSNLPVGSLQNFLDKYLAENGGRIDYIHGNDVVRSLAKEPNTIGFMVDAMEKNDLFLTVIKDGSLPRKTFSMGEAQDKRFYLECKKIK